MESLRRVLELDRFAQLVGIEVAKAAQGQAVARLTIRPEHMNGIGIVHGGVLFTLADLAFAAACNSHGYTAVAINANISYITAAQTGVLTASAQPVSIGHKISTYQVKVADDHGQVLAVFQGTAYRKSEH